MPHAWVNINRAWPALSRRKSFRWTCVIQATPRARGGDLRRRLPGIDARQFFDGASCRHCRTTKFAEQDEDSFINTRPYCIAAKAHVKLIGIFD